MVRIAESIKTHPKNILCLINKLNNFWYVGSMKSGVTVSKMATRLKSLPISDLSTILDIIDLDITTIVPFIMSTDDAVIKVKFAKIGL